MTSPLRTSGREASSRLAGPSPHWADAHIIIITIIIIIEQKTRFPVDG